MCGQMIVVEHLEFDAIDNGDGQHRHSQRIGVSVNKAMLRRANYQDVNARAWTFF